MGIRKPTIKDYLIVAGVSGIVGLTIAASYGKSLIDYRNKENQEKIAVAALNFKELKERLKRLEDKLEPTKKVFNEKGIDIKLGEAGDKTAIVLYSLKDEKGIHIDYMQMEKFAIEHPEINVPYEDVIKCLNEYNSEYSSVKP